MKRILGCLALLFLVGCATPEQKAQAKAQEVESEKFYNGGHVQTVAVAPDGTTLYRVWDNPHVVYFSRGGASWQTTQLQGKVNVTIDHQTPNQQ